MLSVPCGQMDIVTRVRFWMRWCTLAALSLEVQIARVGTLIKERSEQIAFLRLGPITFDES